MTTRPTSTRLPFFVHRCVRRAEAVLRSAGIGNEAVLLGVSGGSDSMALLEITWLLAPRLRLEMHVACIDHGVRPEAGAEVERVRAAAAARGAVFHSSRIDPGAGDEDTLRRARYDALASIARSHACRFVLLGHTSDDQVETIVFRFLRGAGLGGLAGMREARGALLRPLLSMHREELRRLLRARDVTWADDPSNLGERHARGRLRTKVLPAIEGAFGRGALDHLLDVAPRWRADEEFLEIEAARLLACAARRGDAGTELDLDAIAPAHPAMRARVLRRWLAERTGKTMASRELAAVERWLAGAARGSGAIDIAGASVVRRRGRLAVHAKDPSRPFAPPFAQLAQPFTIAPASIDMHASSDDACNPLHERLHPSDCGSEEAVLPPSKGRVRFPRN